MSGNHVKDSTEAKRKQMELEEATRLKAEAEEAEVSKGAKSPKSPGVKKSCCDDD